MMKIFIHIFDFLKINSKSDTVKEDCVEFVVAAIIFGLLDQMIKRAK